MTSEEDPNVLCNLKKAIVSLVRKTNKGSSAWISRSSNHSPPVAIHVLGLLGSLGWLDGFGWIGWAGVRPIWRPLWRTPLCEAPVCAREICVSVSKAKKVQIPVTPLEQKTRAQIPITTSNKKIRSQIPITPLPMTITQSPDSHHPLNKKN